MTYDQRTYTELRRRGEGALFALRIARTDALAEAAGLSRGQDWADGEPVTIGGREYRLTIEPDPDGWRWGDDDVTGRIIERPTDWATGYPLPIDACQVALSERLAYEWPEAGGESYGGHGPRGMARGPAHVWLRAALSREAAPYLAEWEANHYGPGGDDRNHVVTLAAEDGTTESLCGVDGLGDDIYGRGYLYDVLTGLAAEIEHRRLLAAERARDLTYAATAHG